MRFETRKNQLNEIKSVFIGLKTEGLIPWSQLNNEEPFLFEHNKKNFSPVFVKKVWNYGNENACFTFVATPFKNETSRIKNKNLINELSDDFLIRPLNEVQFKEWINGSVSF